MLGGYNRYVIGPKLWRRIGSAPLALRSAIGTAAALLPGWAWSTLEWAPGLGQTLAPFKDKAYKLGPALRRMKDSDDLYEALVTEWAHGAAPVLSPCPAATRRRDLSFAADVREPARRMMLFDGLTYLPDDILTKVDRAAMAVGLETRVPLLDHRVAETAWRLPLSMLIRNGQGKWALRQVLYRYVPQKLVERPKAGFAIPVGQWLRGPLRDWAEDLLSERRLQEEGYLDASAVRSLWTRHRAGRQDWTSRLWNLLMFQAWLSSANTPTGA